MRDGHDVDTGVSLLKLTCYTSIFFLFFFFLFYFRFTLKKNLFRNLISLNMKVCEYHVVWIQNMILWRWPDLQACKTKRKINKKKRNEKMTYENVSVCTVICRNAMKPV